MLKYAWWDEIQRRKLYCKCNDTSWYGQINLRLDWHKVNNCNNTIHWCAFTFFSDFTYRSKQSMKDHTVWLICNGLGILKLWNYGKNSLSRFDLHDRSVLSRHSQGLTRGDYGKIPPISVSRRLIMHSYILQYYIYRIYAHTVPVGCKIWVIIERKRRKTYSGTLHSRLQEAQFVFVYPNSLIYYTSPLGCMGHAAVHWPLQRLLLSSCISDISVI